MTRRTSAESLFNKGNVIKLAAAVSIGTSALFLAGCAPNASAEGPSDTPTSASSTPNPENSPSNPNKFTGTVNYDAFNGFAEMDETAKDVVCAEFFNANLPGSTIDEHATGIAVAQWQADHLDVLSALNSDTSDPRNQEVAEYIVDCLTSTHSEEADAKTELIENLHAQSGGQLEGVKLIHIDPTKVARYSDGLFEAHGQTYGDYAALTMEGYYNDFNETLVQSVYEWNGSTTFPAFKKVDDAPITLGASLPAGGKAPIVVNPAFADAPWS